MLQIIFWEKGGYAYIGKERNRFTGLYYVDEECVSVNKNADPILKIINFLVNGRTYRPYEFLKILRKTKDGCQGISIIQEYETIINVGYNTLRFEKQSGEKRRQ